MSVSEQAVKLLNGLGSTADEIAAALKAEAVQGVRHAVRLLNPIVRFIRERIVIDAESLDVMRRDRLRFTYRGGRTVEAAIPEAVRLFMDAFDRGKYPELELRLEG
jgi:hypothetical protein